MSVTRDVIIDLWPLYESGEASDDTCRIVEQFLAEDIEFANLLQNTKENYMAVGTPPVLNKDHEVVTLRRTKLLLRLRDSLFFIAILLSFTPLTVYDTAWGEGWVIRDHPLVALMLGSLAAVAWFAYFVLRRRLSTVGL